jgi:hypothetical protein
MSNYGDGLVLTGLDANTASVWLKRMYTSRYTQVIILS